VEVEGWPGRLEELVSPVRNSLNEAFESLGQALSRTGMTLDKVREINVAGLVARSPVIVLAAATAVGLAIGIVLSRRR